VEKIGFRSGGRDRDGACSAWRCPVVNAELVKVGDNNLQFASHLSRLEEAVETHTKHEENAVFSLAREHLGKDLVDLGQKVKQREEALKAGGQVAGQRIDETPEPFQTPCSSRSAVQTATPSS